MMFTSFSSAPTWRASAAATLCAGLMVGAGAAGAATPAAPVGAAAERPAVMVQRPAAAVLLGAASAGQRTVAVGER
ncbi:MAG: hypothetical protein RSB42_00765, partial [Comamonas sp.]